MIPRKNQECFYKGERVTVVGVDVSSFPTSYIIQWNESGVVKQSKIDDLTGFTAAPPLPDTMSEMEALMQENAQLRARIAELEAIVDGYRYGT